MPDTIPNDDLPACLKFFCKSNLIFFYKIKQANERGKGRARKREENERLTDLA